MTAQHCATCGSVVSVVTGDEGTSHYRPLLTDEMVERAAEALGWRGDDGFGSFEEAARAALTAALGGPDD